jgi:glycerophosphoryl diester phosphodiesterase
VKDLTLNELRQFDIGRINPESAYAKFFPEQFPVDGTPMPTLREVIRFVNRRAKNSVGFQIEMKTDPAQPHLSPDPEIFARALLRVLKEEKVLARSEIQAFDFRCLAALQKMDRKTKTAYLTSRENTPDGKISFPQLIKNLGGYAWEPEDSELTQNDLAEAKRLGLKVVVWSWTEKQGIAFDPTMVAKMIAWGVDGIITDDPGRLASMLAARGLPVPPRFTIF